MRILFVLFFFSSCLSSVAQQPEEIAEQQPENSIRINMDEEMEDHSFLQQLQLYLDHPVNLNTAAEADIAALPFVTPVQAGQLLSYRNLFGNFIDLYELQAVPGWGIELLSKIRMYVTVSSETKLAATIKQRFEKSNAFVLLRMSRVLERTEGYKHQEDSSGNYYPGSPLKLLFRFTANDKDLLQYGVLAEKDAGEQFFKGAQKQGFDFYSVHIFMRRLGILKAVAIGDFTVRLGQGLTEWQGLSFTGGDAGFIKRQGPVLAPYHSVGETGFHRGVGITAGKGQWEVTGFGSYRKIDGNLINDTVTGRVYASSLPASGYHRTASEAADKSVQQQIAFGGRLAWGNRKLKLGFNAINYTFRYNLDKGGEPYERYALKGRNWFNYSIDYAYTFRNCHVFGELAAAKGGGHAFLGGLVLNLSSLADMNLLYRNISPDYQSVSGSAFTRNTLPANEKGLFMGLILRPVPGWRIDAFADLYSFPWLRYRVHAPSHGADYSLHLSWKPARGTELYAVYRFGNQPVNFSPFPASRMPGIGSFARKNLRIQLDTRLFGNCRFRARAELLWTKGPGGEKGTGALFYADLVGKPGFFRGSLGGRLQYFETDGYENRLYAYENDVLYSSSNAVFYDKGLRYYINIKYKMAKRLVFWLRFSQTLSRDKTLTGSGLDHLFGGSRSEVKFQSIYKL